MLTPEELGSQHAQDDDDDDNGFFKVCIYRYLEEAMGYVYPYIHDAQDEILHGPAELAAALLSETNPLWASQLN